MKKIDSQRAKELLELYFEGVTTLEQESDLRNYFKTGEVDPELRKYSSLFEFFNDEIEKINRVESRRYWIRPRFLYSLSSVAAIALFTLIFWPKEQSTGSFRLVLDGLEINNEQAAVSMADNQLQKLNVMMEKVDNKSESLNKLNKVEEAISGLNRITSKIK